MEAAEEREIYLACERMGTTYKNKAERIEEAKNNGTYDSPEPSPREEFGSRPPTRDLLYGEDRGFDFEEFAVSRPNTAERPQIVGRTTTLMCVSSPPPRAPRADSRRLPVVAPEPCAVVR